MSTSGFGNPVGNGGNPVGNDQPDDALLRRFGYGQQFARTLKRFESFAVAFSFISITTGIFTTFLFVLTVAGPRGSGPGRS